MGICVTSNGKDPHSLEKWRWDRRKIPGRQPCREKKEISETKRGGSWENEESLVGTERVNR